MPRPNSHTLKYQKMTMPVATAAVAHQAGSNVAKMPAISATAITAVTRTHVGVGLRNRCDSTSSATAA